jgi:hypothetical protein
MVSVLELALPGTMGSQEVMGSGDDGERLQFVGVADFHSTPKKDSAKKGRDIQLQQIQGNKTYL